LELCVREVFFLPLTPVSPLMQFSVFLLAFLALFVSAMSVKVEIIEAFASNAKVTTASAYDAQVTLSIENADGSLTPSGWSTRKESGGDDKPFSFTPGQNLIQGWTEGVLQMREGERAKIHVPSAKGYGASPMGQKGAGCECLAGCSC
jgi:hypothetical protein